MQTPSGADGISDVSAVNRITIWTLMDPRVSVKVMKELTCRSVLNEPDMLLSFRRVSGLTSSAQWKRDTMQSPSAHEEGWRAADAPTRPLCSKKQTSSSSVLPAGRVFLCLSTLLLLRLEVSIKYLWICLNFEWLRRTPSSSIAQLYKVKPGSIKACLIFAGAFCNINEAV